VNAQPLYACGMRFLELFAGAGGASCGIHAAGHSSVGIEWDADAVATAQAAGHDTRLGDVRDLELLRSLGEFDAVWSSFPCQAWSGAGKRLGSADERNGWPWTLAAIDEIKPRHFVAENVTGLTHHRGECARGCIGAPDCPRAYFDVEIIGALRARFAVVEWRILNAADFGVPQHRRRVIIQAGEVVRWPEPTHAAPGTAAQGDLFGRTLASWVTAREALGITLGTTSSHGSGRIPEYLGDVPSPTITSQQAKQSSPWKSAGMPYAVGPVLQSGVASPKAYSSTRGMEHPTTGPSPAITTGAMYLGATLRGMAGSMPGLLDRPSPTVTTTEAKGTRGGNMYSDLGNGKRSGGPDRASDALWLATGRRRLTVHECAALQGFPPHHPWRGNKQSQYTQVGNAVPPALAQAITKEISC